LFCQRGRSWASLNALALGVAREAKSRNR
jgi:hypothetical protein